MTIAQPIRHMIVETARVRTLGRDRHADAATLAVALEPEAPLLCFSSEAAKSGARAFLAGFPGETAYAVKANPAPELILSLAEAGLSIFDVASLAEIELVRSLAPGATVNYHNPIKSRSEISRAYRSFGVRRFAADTPEEITKIADIAGADPSLEIAIRFRLAAHGKAAHDFSSKFGATAEDASRLLGTVARAGYQPVLTFHPGSQCMDPEAYVRHIEAAGAIARKAGVTLAALNVGGGFPVRYLGAEPPALESYLSAIEAAAAAAFPGAVPHLECEPGRALSAASMSLLTRVKAVRSGSGEVFLNDGIYGSLLEVAQAPKLQPCYRVIRNGTHHQGAARPFTVYGPTCDPLDRLPNALLLPADITEDDYIEFGPLGAYSGATSTGFNGFGRADIVAVERVLEA